MSIAAAWASPACKSNEVNQTENTTNNFSTIVGPNGATFDGPEGTKVRIPPGALDKDTEISIYVATAGEYPPTKGPAIGPDSQPVAWTPEGKVWAFLPHGLKFYVEPTMWLPAPPGTFHVVKAQPGGAWEYTTASGSSVDGRLEFKTNSFSFYTLVPADGMLDPCARCRKQCTEECAADGGTSMECYNTCQARCESTCGPSGVGDAALPPDSTTGCTPMCPKDGMANGVACTSCGSPWMCNGLNGPTEVRCTCEPKMSGDLGGTLTNCMPTGGGGSDSGVSDSGAIDTAPPSTCPTKTQTEGTGTFSGFTVQSAYAFYKENFLGSSYYSQLWLVLSDQPGACTRSVSRQAGGSSKTLRIRLEAKNTTTPYVFSTGTYAEGTTFGVIGDGQSLSSTCGPTGTRDMYNGGTIDITSTAGGRYQGTFTFPAMGPSLAGNGTFDVPICLEDNPGPTGDPACCK